MLTIFGIIVAIILIYIWVTYNSLIRLDNQVKEAFSTMDVYLKKRWDLIPNIIETVKGYAQLEKSTLKEITELRSRVYNNMNNDLKVDTNEKLSNQLSELMIIAENYPDLKANESFNDLSDKLTKVEEDIANSRKYYNGAVRVYNNKVQMFPSSIVASMFRYKEEKMFEITSVEKTNVKVDLEGK